MSRPPDEDPELLPPTLPVTAFADLETLLRSRGAEDGQVEPCGWALVVYAGPQLGRLFPLAMGENVLGRAPGTAIALPDEEVSRAHACLRLAQGSEGDQLTLVDLGSTNGTLVGGERIGGEPVPLTPGMQVRLGQTVLELRR